MRTGTKLLEKGVNIAKFGFNILKRATTEDSAAAAADSNDSEDGDAENGEGDGSGDGAKGENSAELKWVMVY